MLWLRANCVLEYIRICLKFYTIPQCQTMRNRPSRMTRKLAISNSTRPPVGEQNSVTAVTGARIAGETF